MLCSVGERIVSNIPSSISFSLSDAFSRPSSPSFSNKRSPLLAKANVTDSPALQKYIIGNYSVGTFILNTNDEMLGSTVTQQIFLIERNDQISILEYIALEDDFWSKESQDILNHIIKSFRFI